MTTTSYPVVKRIGFVAGVLFFAAIIASRTPAGMTQEGQKVAAVLVLMAVWWMVECIPIPATALLPLVFFPLLGVLPMKTVSASFGDANILLFIGGFFIAMAMQKWNLHKRIALHIVHAVGTNPRRMVLGFMIATAVLSMWISNTATTMMMLPIALSVVGELELGAEDKHLKRFATTLMLGIAYAASIGGIGTLIGTPPNAIVFGSGRLSVAQMAAPGVVLNLIGVVFVTLLTYLLAVPIFGIVLGQAPDWIQ